MELLADIVRKLEGKFPKELMEEWDNVGLMIESENKEINNVMIVLDVTNEVIDEAINKDIDLIISHHPLIFTKEKIMNITEETILGKKIIKLIKNDISVYSMHTNLDIADGGMNDYILGKLDIVDITKTEVDRCMRCGKLKQEMKVIDFTNYLKERLNIENVNLATKDENKLIRNIAVITGGGSSSIEDASKIGTDLYITGDVKYNNALIALECDISVIDAGHYGTEKIVVDIVSNYLIDNNMNVNIVTSQAMKNPIKVC